MFYFKSSVGDEFFCDYFLSNIYKTVQKGEISSTKRWKWIGRRTWTKIKFISKNKKVALTKDFNNIKKKICVILVNYWIIRKNLK